MRKNLLRAREAAAQAVWNSGTISIRPEKGHKLKIHETYPNAPRSPIYVSLRPAGVKDGKLSADDLNKIGYAMAMMAVSNGLFQLGEKTWVAGIPAAGEPIVDAIWNNVGEQRAKRMSRFRLLKEETDKGRRIAGVHPDYDDSLPTQGDSEYIPRHVLVDDLMSNALTKLEAITAVNDIGASVSTLLLFLDRSDGGAEMLSKRYCVRTFALWTYGELLEFGLAHRHIDRRTFEQIIEYPQQLQSYIADQAA